MHNTVRDIEAQTPYPVWMSTKRFLNILMQILCVHYLELKKGINYNFVVYFVCTELETVT